MSADTEALLATVREALLAANEDVYGPLGNQDSLAALDSLAAELERLRLKADAVQSLTSKVNEDMAAELERVKAERDAWKAQMLQADQDDLITEARLDKALAALRGLTAGLKYLTPDQIAETPRDATAILDVPCGAVQDALAVIAEGEAK